MPTKSTPVSSTKKPSRTRRIPRAGKVSSKSFGSAWSTSKSKKSKAPTQKQRFNFVMGAVLAAAALIAVAIGLTSYTKPVPLDSKSVSQNSVQSNKGAGGAQASLSLQPMAYAQTVPDQIVTVTVYENSQTEAVNAVQGLVRYPADKLQFVGIKTAGAFSQEAATDTATAGRIRFARSIGAGGVPQTGEKQVVTLSFKVLRTVDLASAVTVDWGESYLVRSSDSQNILGQSAGSLQLRP